MNKQWKWLALLPAVALGLSACGSSGSSGPDVSINSPGNGGAGTGNSGAGTGNSGAGTGNSGAGTGNSGAGNDGVSKTVSGQFIRIPHDGALGLNGATEANSDINYLMVDGKRIQLPPKQSVNFDTNNPNSPKSIISGSHMAYARYGMYNDEQAKADYLFAQGHTSDKVPANGIIQYAGQAVYGSDAIGGMVTAQSKFTVDFGAAKSLSGTISGEGFADVALRAKINGNGFEGTHDGTKTVGQFYGPNAAELSGTFVNSDKNFGGAFGAKQQ